MREVFPLLPLRGVLVFPSLIVPLEIGRDKSVKALDKAVLGDRRIVFVSQKDPQIDDPGEDDLYRVGTLAEIKQVVKLPGGTVKAVVEGIERVAVEAIIDSDEFFEGEVSRLEKEEAALSKETEALMLSVMHLYEQYMKLSHRIPDQAMISLDTDNPGRLADSIAAGLEVKTADRQAILESVTLDQRLHRLHEMLAEHVELLELERKISSKVRSQMERAQKEYYLREQLKAIQGELGDASADEGGQGEAAAFKDKIEAANLPEEAREKALREVGRLERMPGMSAEAVVVRNYLDWLTSLPWNLQTEDQLNLKKATAMLNHDHYGLEKVKERIIEHLALRSLVPESKGPILCLVGPPGVGKTSLGQSIARALGRSFVRTSLGGVRDEAEIRGHRRTYVGSLPGRIIQGMRQAKSSNPVFLLDEVDKMAQDFRGDPSAALLEVLDPEQNATFSDHFIELPFDLSQVLFLTTANTIAPIPRPLLDRMEVISLEGYTEAEKRSIATRHLIPEERAGHGLTAQDVTFTDGALRLLIGRYTREAGVRQLKRLIATLCRKIATERLKEHTSEPVRLTTRNLSHFLGKPLYRAGMAEKRDQVGVATAVYWTEMGGDIMPLEVSVLPGKGSLLLTGSLGEVMRESAQAALSYIRSRSEALDLKPDFYEHSDIHVHVPEGATPKEGPSAGITMATAMVSALTGRPVRADVAMTGEITLRGRVLPIGGLKEKALAAHRAGIHTIIIPADNARDIEEIPPTIRHKIHWVEAHSMDQVLATALAAAHPTDG